MKQRINLCMVSYLTVYKYREVIEGEFENE